jgi:hypothetical protein
MLMFCCKLGETQLEGAKPCNFCTNPDCSEQAKNKRPSFAFGAFVDMRFHYAELGQKLPEPFPSLTLVLATAIEILPHLTDYLIAEERQASDVAMHAIVIEVPG